MYSTLLSLFMKKFQAAINFNVNDSVIKYNDQIFISATGQLRVTTVRPKRLDLNSSINSLTTEPEVMVIIILHSSLYFSKFKNFEFPSFEIRQCIVSNVTFFWKK